MAERTLKKWRMVACLLWLVPLLACQSQQSEGESSQNTGRTLPLTASSNAEATLPLDQPGGGSPMQPSVSTPNQAAQQHSGGHSHGGGGDEPDLAMGEIVFLAHCNGCHDAYSDQPKPDGGSGLMNLFKVPMHALPGGDFHIHTEDYVRNAIEQGVGTMPGMAKDITPIAMRDLMAYLKTI
ncbi:MAG: cytochrome c [Acidobacteria bacterium]|nr:cytochrome c [Acidobacteriota bacterium]